MTAQLSREDVESFIKQVESDMSKGWEAQAFELKLAKHVLAGMDSESVAVIDKEGSPMTRAECNDDRVFAICCKVGTPLYAAPPAQVSVPDERAAFEAFMSERFGSTIDRSRVKNGDGEYMAWDMQVAWIVWRRRAAMLKAGPVAAATVPEGWKLVPVEPTEEMMLHNSGCQRHSWDDADCALRQTRRLVWAHMLAAAPAAPEQEV